MNADPTTDVLFNIVNIVTPELMDRGGLSLQIAPPPFSLLVQPFTSLNQGITVDNRTISGKLSTAPGETVTKIQHIVGKKCVLSYSRDEQGDFFIYVNSILIFREAQWPIGYGAGLRIKRSLVRIRPWPLR